MDAVLVATLGAEPQVTTLAAQRLLAASPVLGRAVVLHTRPPCAPIDRALRALPALSLLPVPAADRRAAAGDDVHLVDVSFVRPRPVAPRFARPCADPTPAQAFASLSTLHARPLHCFVAHEPTPAERAVATLLAGVAPSVDAMAARRRKSPRTLRHQLSSVYSKLKSCLGVAPAVGLKRAFHAVCSPPILSRLGQTSHDSVPVHPYTGVQRGAEGYPSA